MIILKIRNTCLKIWYKNWTIIYNQITAINLDMFKIISTETNLTDSKI